MNIKQKTLSIIGSVICYVATICFMENTHGADQVDWQSKQSVRLITDHTGKGSEFKLKIPLNLQREYDSVVKNGRDQILLSAGNVAYDGVGENFFCQGCGVRVAHGSYSLRGGGTASVFLSKENGLVNDPPVAQLHGIGSHVGGDNGTYEVKFCNSGRSRTYTLRGLHQRP